MLLQSISSAVDRAKALCLPAIFEKQSLLHVMENGHKRKENAAPSSSAAAKRRRQDEDSSQGAGRFEHELASLQQSTGNPKSKWSRPQVPRFDPAKDAIVFQQLEVDHYVGELSRMRFKWRQLV